MSVITLTAFSRTCRRHRDAVAHFVEKAWEIERTLTFLTWFEITQLMHWLQESGGIITGAAAFSFFSRIELPDLMVDIVVEWRQADMILKYLSEIGFSRDHPRPQILQDDVSDSQRYIVGDEIGQYPIADIVEMGRDGGGWIRVILADCSPLAVVLSFNSSECVSYACSHCLKEITHNLCVSWSHEFDRRCLRLLPLPESDYAKRNHDSHRSSSRPKYVVVNALGLFCITDADQLSGQSLTRT